MRVGSRDGAKLSAELVGQAGGRADCLCCPGRLDFGAVSAVTFKSDVAATFGLFSRCMRTRKRRGGFLGKRVQWGENLTFLGDNKILFY